LSGTWSAARRKKHHDKDRGQSGRARGNEEPEVQAVDERGLSMLRRGSADAGRDRE
jgi:hypothetical protein